MGVRDKAKAKRKELVMQTKVVNKRNNSYDVYIGRGSIWGNPFRIGPDGSREDVIRKYEEWVVKQKEIMSRIEELRGKRLGCFCKPYACHGDVLVRLLEKTK